MSRLDDTIQAKTEKREALEAAGVTVHPHHFDKQHTIAEAIAAEGTEQTIQTAGRLTSLRAHGKVIFADIQDHSGSIQIMLRQETIGDDAFDQMKKYIDSGDFLGVTGEVITTKTGEITVQVTEYTFLGKALRALPSEWNVSDDKEVRFRKRYVDMLVNSDVKAILDARWLVEKEIRRYLQDQFDFVEVETPILQALYGGTNAKPFSTHMNALDSDFYLRIAPELYLKRLIVGGYERIFEIARNFRNEGIDQTHQPEFTMIEWYHSYADYHTMMDVAEGLIKHLVEKLHSSTELHVMEHTIDVGGEWPRITMVGALKEYAQIDYEAASDEELRSALAEHKIELQSVFTRGKALFALFDELVTPHLIQPTWIIDYPRDVSPLAKHHRLNPEFAERFEAYVGGKELADGWSEIVDPIDQRNIFENEQRNMRAGDDEAHPLDEDFIEAMEHGMPPLGGIGMGIDRLVMFLTNTWSIREVIAFPTLRPLTPTSDQTSILAHADHSAVTEEGAAEDNTEGGNTGTSQMEYDLPSREHAEALLEEYIDNEALRHHCRMVGRAMEAYANDLGEDPELWYQAGLLHDLDWEKYPDEHPNKAVTDILADEYPQVLLDAILAHAPGRTGRKPQTTLERYLFACDELSGFMHAYSLMRPEGFAGMKASKVNKKLKDVSFAANVDRDDIKMGFELLGVEPNQHVQFLITVFSQE